MIDLKKYSERLNRIESTKIYGQIREARGLVIESDGPPVSIGEICEITSKGREEPILAEVIGFRGNSVLLMPIYELGGIKLGDRIVSRKIRPSVPVCDGLLGRVVDGNGSPIDDKGPIGWSQQYPLNRNGLNPLARKSIERPLGSGVRAIDGLLTVGRGQRVGIFGGSGVGKSTLLGMMAKNTDAAVSVIALVGERGREVRAFIEKDLGEEGLRRSVVVVSTSDNPPLMRIRAALAATAVAEYFRDQGKDVLLVMDSVTRVAMAQREVGLAAGEPPSSKGYTPSVFALLPRLFERAGNFEKGSITGFYTVLVEGDDMNEPIADAVRGLLDGHVVLARELAWSNHFPAIDILGSISRLMPDLVAPDQSEAARRVRELMATYKKAEDMINIGAYKKGSNPKIDLALSRHDRINDFLQQRAEDKVTREAAVQELVALVQQ
jgi:flagellum-specific ATP synthase